MTFAIHRSVVSAAIYNQGTRLGTDSPRLIRTSGSRRKRHGELMASMIIWP
jgi:hypothetical protein